MNATSRSSLINPSHTLYQRLQGRRIKTSSLRRLDSLYLYRRFRNLHIRQYPLCDLFQIIDIIQRMDGGSTVISHHLI
jgi:hypothetical protein